ncbi:MGDG synthase family glycosyltransferase [Pseudomonas sp.]|uniref:MGDG synthase family glycosyltransferase n=1 Tax=Pseudomonas sp. TaxID=306 RepID=UPI003D121553
MRGNGRVVIFYSSIGYGHISAAQFIQDEILRQSPATQVLLQDIRIFMHPVWRRVDERLYWFVANNLSECFESLFRATQARGSHVASLSMLPNDYPEESVSAYLTAQRPDAVLATHYGAAQVLGTLREKGLLSDTRIGWLHTDFFEGYFPRISKRIDRTFLAHPELEVRWLAAGVPADKVVTSGMPVRTPATSADARRATLQGLGLSADVPTLLLTGGKEGAGDYPGVIGSVVRHCPGHLQIIAVCGANSRQYKVLADLQERLPERVTLKPLGLLPRGDMASCMAAADILVTKAGGMTPAEAFALGVPTVLLDVISGHERENAALFQRQGLARFAASADDAGKFAMELLCDRAQREAMLRAQRELRQSIDIASIVRFALDDGFRPAYPLPDYGVENGAPVLGIDQALAQLDSEAPAEVELLLSYATSKTPRRFVLENPFGHLAIRISDTVYSANYIADPSVDPNFLQQVSLADYLYGIHRPSRSQVHTNTYGMAYGRETLGLRVQGIPAERRVAMVAEAHRIENGFREASLRWSRSDLNCADVVARILAAGGYSDRSLYDRAGLPSMPLDLFERMRAHFEADTSLQEELVAYRLLPGTQASYRFSRFPLSVGQPLRSMARVLSDAPRDALEQATTRQVTGYFGDRQLYVEDLQACWPASETADSSFTGRPYLALEQAILADLRRLLAVYVKLPLKRIERQDSLPAAQEFHRLVDRGLQLARLATEYAEDDLRPRTDRLRALFTQLVEGYGRIDPQRLESRHVRSYLARLRAFESALGRELVPASTSWALLPAWWHKMVALARTGARSPPRSRGTSGSAACGLIREKSSLTAMRKNTVRILSKLIRPHA